MSSCKNMGDGGGGHCLVRMKWHPAGGSVCLPLLIFPCTIKSISSLLAPAHPGGPGKRAVKRLWCVVVVPRAVFGPLLGLPMPVPCYLGWQSLLSFPRLCFQCYLTLLHSLTLLPPQLTCQYCMRVLGYLTRHVGVRISHPSSIATFNCLLTRLLTESIHSMLRCWCDIVFCVSVCN